MGNPRSASHRIIGCQSSVGAEKINSCVQNTRETSGGKSLNCQFEFSNSKFESVSMYKKVVYVVQRYCYWYKMA
ncbi:unnamed protein product [Leptosia nina]|uniref:Uncharacterized protein n=1 Tax=Leptosia nina TaxID=320188 RepID=A0AAV1J5Y5_9NEOP